jgi:hypothetical protein
MDVVPCDVEGNAIPDLRTFADIGLTRPDKPGIWAYQFGYTNERVWLISVTESQLPWPGGMAQRWCYVGPLPEILPMAVKTERLWIMVNKKTGESSDQWVVSGDPFPKSATDGGVEYVMTDKTREVEV